VTPLTILAPHSIVRTVAEAGVTEEPGARALGYEALAQAIPWADRVELAADIPAGEHLLLVPSGRLEEVAAAGRLAMAFVVDASPTALLTLVESRGLAGATDGMTLRRWHGRPDAGGPVVVSGWAPALRSLGHAVGDAPAAPTVGLDPPLPDAIAAYLRAYLAWRARHSD
jgi:hypothetical protein